jgi:hypothetical protein
MTYPSTTPSTRLAVVVREQADTAFDDFWGEPIHVYTRQQAIEDGVLVDASSGILEVVSLQHFGPKAHVAMTAGLHNPARPRRRLRHARSLCHGGVPE